MTHPNAIQVFHDYLKALGFRVSLAPFLAGVFFVYLTIASDNDPRRATAYALTAVTFFCAAMFISAGIGQLDFGHVLALVSLH